MKKNQIFPLLIFCSVVFSHSISWALYERLLEQIHDRAKVQAPEKLTGEKGKPKEKENVGTVVFIFEKPKSIFRLHREVISSHRQLARLLEESIDDLIEDIHPLSILLYLNYLQTNEISFAGVDHSELPSPSERIAIVSSICTFEEGLNEDEKCSFEIAAAISQFLVAQLEDESIQWKEIEQSRDQGQIPDKVWQVLFGEGLKKINEMEYGKKSQALADKIDKRAQQICQFVKNNHTYYERKLAQLAKESSDPKYVCGKSASDDSPEEYYRACEIYNKNTENTLRLECEPDAMKNRGPCDAEDCACCCCFCFYLPYICIKDRITRCHTPLNRYAHWYRYNLIIKQR